MHPIAQKWPAKHPERLQLYSFATPNGVKAAIMLEEIGLPYEPHLVDIMTNANKSPEFVSLNPNGKIPAIYDPDGDVAVFESGAILIYLADKTKSALLPAAGAARYHVLAWLMFQMGGVGPMFGQLGFFHKLGGKDYEDKRPRDRYAAETERLLGVLEGQYAKHAWVAGPDYSIADIAILPWVRALVTFYGAADLVHYDKCPGVARALAEFVERPAVKRGLTIPAKI
jgi:GST-like protein